MILEYRVAAALAIGAVVFVTLGEGVAAVLFASAAGGCVTLGRHAKRMGDYDR